MKAEQQRRESDGGGMMERKEGYVNDEGGR